MGGKEVGVKFIRLVTHVWFEIKTVQGILKEIYSSRMSTQQELAYVGLNTLLLR